VQGDVASIFFDSRAVVRASGFGSTSLHGDGSMGERYTGNAQNHRAAERACRLVGESSRRARRNLRNVEQCQRTADHLPENTAHVHLHGFGESM
jgi:hypothetical protein